MTGNMEGLILQKEIKELTLLCNETKAQALGVPRYYQGSEWATASNAIATNTPCNKPLSPEEEFLCRS